MPEQGSFRRLYQLIPNTAVSSNYEEDMRVEIDIEGGGRSFGTFRRDFTKVRLGDSMHEQEIETNGPDLVTGDGMEAQKFITKWEEPPPRRFQPAWMGGSKSDRREEIYQGLVAMSKQRMDNLELLLQFNPARAQEYYKITAYVCRGENPRTSLYCDWQAYKDQLDYYSRSFNNAKDAEDAKNHLRRAVFFANLLQRYEWDVTHLDRVKGRAGRVPQDTFDKACQQVGESNGSDGQAAETIIYEINRSYKNIESFMLRLKPEGSTTIWVDNQLIEETWRSGPISMTMFEEIQKECRRLISQFESNLLGIRSARATNVPLDRSSSDQQYSDQMLNDLPTRFVENARDILAFESRAQELLVPSIDRWLQDI